MNQAFKTGLSLCLATGLALTANATSACDKDGAAHRYLDAIQTMNWSRMATLLAPNAQYTDPTMVYFDRPAIKLDSAREIVEFWRDASTQSGTTDIHYTVVSCFETASYHVFTIEMKVTVAGRFWNVNRDQITIPGSITSIVKVENEKITAHHDYVDYAGGERHTDYLRQQWGAAEPETP